MISRIHSKLGTAGLVVAIVALVAALGGGAYAAQQGLNAKQKNQVKTIAQTEAKKFSGVPGPAGAAGPAGPQGKEGPQGKQGNQGIPGEDGETGFTKTLPTGETETGAWATRTTSVQQESSLVPISFNIPLSDAPTAMYYVNKNEDEFKLGEGGPEYVTPVNCTGSVAEPTAPAGALCIYAEGETLESIGWYPLVPDFENLYSSGATFFYLLGAEGTAFGTWAVTAS